MDKTSSTILKLSSTRFTSLLESSLDSFLFQQSFLRCPDLPLYQHFSFLFDLDLYVPIYFSPLSLDQPLTTNASDVKVSILDFLHTSSNKKVPTTYSKRRVSIVLKLIEVAKSSQHLGNEHNNITYLSSSSNFTSILVNSHNRVLNTFK